MKSFELFCQLKVRQMYLSIHFTGNSFFRFGKLCGKVFPKTAAFYLR